MKDIVIKFYGILMMILFFIYNIVFTSLKVNGLLYQLGMIILIIFNLVMLIKFRKEIKLKSLIIIIYVLIWLFSKDIYQCLLAFSNIIFFCILGFKDSLFIKVITILLILFIMKFFMLLYFIFLWIFLVNPNGEVKDIYEDTHYYCDDNMEVYAYSQGAIDKFHYSVGKHYEILNINGIIQITFRKRNEVTKEKYDDYIKNHKCTLVGDIDGSK